MSGTLPSWLSRIAALALLVSLVAAAYLYVVAPLLSAYGTTDEAIAANEDLLAGYEAIAATRGSYRQQLDELGKRQAGTGVYLSGATDHVAGAELQDLVRAAVVSKGGELRSIQVLPVEADGDFLRVSVRVQFSGTLSATHRILYQLESAKPFLFVDNLDIRNRRARRRSEVENEDPQLTIRFDLSGYLQPGTG